MFCEGYIVHNFRSLTISGTNVAPTPQFSTFIKPLLSVGNNKSPGETNPLFQMAINTQSPHTTQTEQ